MQRVLITGVTGFVGGWLADELARHYPYAALFGTTTHSASDAPANLSPDLTLLTADLTDPAAVRAAVAAAGPTHVFHLAGFASGAGTDAERIHRVNVDATVSLLSALEAEGRTCRVQLASSGYVYGVTSPQHPAQEADAAAPSGAYAESKAAMEKAVRPYAENGLLSLTVTRSFNHTGPRQGTDFVVPAFARQIARIEAEKEPPVVRVGNLEARRDFLDVRDVVRAYRLLLFEADPAPWRVVNVASGISVTIRSLLDSLVAHAALPVTVETDPARLRPSDLPECVGDSRLLTALTGWLPNVPLKTTLENTLDYWRTAARMEAG
ncbi:MAG: GDP-mannose 4,6-dehydratase [Cytophagales bacterium]|nr:GDP-mannose 4,6-dehydratase [Armatimonadota bacterium]